MLRAQDDLVAWWQLRELGWAEAVADQWVRRHGWRSIHKGVYAVFRGELTQRQRWVAAVLTAPRTFLYGHSACSCHGFIEGQGETVQVVRPGSGGPRRYPGLTVYRSSMLEGRTDRVEGIPVLSAADALISVSPSLDPWQRGRAFREAIRLGATTAEEISQALAGQRGSRSLGALCDRYGTLPYHRCRSDAESRGLEILHDAEIPPPAVNVQVNGPRPDFTWRRHKLIIEIDGPQFHLFADEDARKEARWRAAGYRVLRLPSPEVYAHPERLVALYRANVPDTPS